MMKKIILAVALLALAACTRSPSVTTAVFVDCISGSGAVFYGASWCPHCNEQKALFGSSASKLPYVECSTSAGQAEQCAVAGIRAYPTWKFNDGTEAVGMLSFDDLGARTGCAVPSGK